MIQSQKSHLHAVGGMFVFLLLGIYALFAVLMVLLSAQLYRSTINHSAGNNDRRVLTSYLMNTVHAGDRGGAISSRNESGTEVLSIAWPQEDGSAAYETLIYCHDGMLCELLADSAEPFDPAFGEKICEAQALRPVINGKLLTIGYTDAAGTEGSLSIRLYAAEQEAAE